MKPFPRLDFSLRRFRRQLASVDALPQLCLLGLVAGIVTGGLMVAFRLTLDLGGMMLMPDGDSEAFETLSPVSRSLLPFIAVLLIGLGLWRQPAGARKMGVAHVIERLAYHQGRFPLRNWINQCWVGVVTVIGGLSAGREGPAIHLGAAAASGLGEKFRLPHNSLRVLVACGTAAGISASFNTPIAGVIFAMEVVMMEYTIAGFMPVILASTIGAVVAQFVYGSEPAFQVPSVSLGSLSNLPWIVVSALCIGMLAGVFVHIAKGDSRLSAWPAWLKLGLVGLVTGALAWWYPEVQGIGYDSLALSLNGQQALDVLVALAIAKLMLSALTVACGVPIGIIGPVLVAGAAAGTLSGLFGGWLWPAMAADPSLYAMLGMAAMLGAVLQAPLAALMALLELTHNPNIILPGMLSVVISGLTARQLHCQGFYMSMLQQGLHPLQQPLMQALSRVSVPAVMERRLVCTQRMVALDEAKSLLEDKPSWIVILRSTDDKPTLALKAADLARALLDHTLEPHANGRLDLLEVPGVRLDMAPIHAEATLTEALARLDKEAVNALYVADWQAPKTQRISGIVTRDAIEHYYRDTL
ncbi:chloride channel protein [Aidingimonas halophila]|uniref:H+/Cl-antiporter ClcA n=1 Tax=Aidingimonas halophila TaxID=574349 RepID=A0A1H2XML2_9GAMM|nr:chloride channel protein [Aidingimonas halophila]GHC28926.1 chloride channel protein [Aidingimonas halophila]SDW93529.1 H+/Cl-antiporter ClcA [Aidingimonas halophila]